MLAPTIQRGLAATLVLCLVAPTSAAHAEEPLSGQLRSAQAFAASRDAANQTSLPWGRFPQLTLASGAWQTVPASAWTSGFFPGSLWLEYQRTADPAWRTRARTRQAPIAARRTDSGTHDLGFMFGPTFVQAYRLTGDPAYRSVALVAAGSLARRYDPRTGMVRSRNTPEDFHVIVDTMMNVELLYWGARNGGPRNWRDLATRHALRTASDFVRTDGSTYHLVVYDEVTGAVKDKGTRQGAGPETAWARGQAWALYGFTAAWRESGDPRLLEAARRTADFYGANLPPDAVPYWDFSASGEAEPRDSSAAAAAASGLLELASLDPDAERRGRYADAARRSLSSLAGEAYLARGTGVRSLLLHGTLDAPRGSADTGTSWGDYYFQEAMLRLRLLRPDTTPLRIARVRASASSAGHPPAAVLDGATATRWVSAGRDQWLQFDLGGTREVAAVTVAVHGGASRAATFDVLLSGDGTAWRRAMRTMSSGRTARAETYDFADAPARYVRLVFRGTTRGALNEISEVCIY